MKIFKIIGILLVVLGIVIFVERNWPRPVVQEKIVTVYDTVPVTQFDTVYIKGKDRIHWDTVSTEKIVVTDPIVDTVKESKESVGIVAVYSPRKVGDTLVIGGFKDIYDSTGVLTRRLWRGAWYSRGPLEAITLDTFPPRVSFYQPQRESVFKQLLPQLSAGVFTGVCSSVKLCLGVGVGLTWHVKINLGGK